LANRAFVQENWPSTQQGVLHRWGLDAAFAHKEVSSFIVHFFFADSPITGMQTTSRYIRSCASRETCQCTTVQYHPMQKIPR
jgi:hypothetical protein